MDTSPKSALEEAHQLLEARNKELVRTKQTEIASKAAQEERAKLAKEYAEAERERLGSVPIYTPDGVRYVLPPLPHLIKKHRDALEQKAKDSVELVRKELAEDKDRLSKFIKEHGAESFTSHQLARAGLPPLPPMEPHSTRKNLTEEFALDAKIRDGLDQHRIHIEHQARRDDLAATPDRMGLFSREPIPRENYESSVVDRDAHLQALDAQAKAKKLEEERQRSLTERFKDLSRDGRAS